MTDTELTSLPTRWRSRADLFGEEDDVARRTAQMCAGELEGAISEDIEETLDEMVRYWRDSDEAYAEYYVDAVQSVRKNILGATLPQESET